MTFAVLLQKDVTVVQLQPVSGALKNLDTVVVQGTVDAKAYPTGAFIECISPDNSVVLADVKGIDPNATTFTDSFVLGNPVNPWKSGTYTFKLFWNPENGPGLPLTATATFQYQA